MKPPLIIVSGPSGSGKSTLIKMVVARYPDRLRLAVSATTRQKRSDEVADHDYYFWTREQFEAGLREGKFLEHAIVHGFDYYGTPRAEVEGHPGKGVFLDIDVQGAEQVRPLFPEHLSVFVKLPALWVYCQRLEERGQNTPESIVKRLGTAVAELKRVGEYHKVIVNEGKKPEIAAAELERLVRERFPGWLPD